MKRYLKTILAIVIVTLTISAFAYYLSTHPETIDQLRSIPLRTLLVLLTLYAMWFGTLVLITRVTLRLYQKTMGRQENILLNAYSSLINFFGPGQSGPIFRGAYLKQRHNLEVKKFVFASLLYYGFYAVLSVMLMFIGTKPWWQTTLLIVGVGVVSFVIIRWYATKKAHIGDEPGINLVNLSLLFGATLLQMILQVAIYGVELHHAGANASLGQVLAYTGVANLALFVALTPGAIGIRESFLLFSQNLHQISSAVIVAASIIDRAVYLVFLGLLFIMVLGLHAKEKLHIKQIKV